MAEPLPHLIETETTPPQWQADLSMELYHQDRTAVSQGLLQEIGDDLEEDGPGSPAQFLEAWRTPYDPVETTPERLLGTIGHMCALEGARYAQLVAVEPRFEGRNADGSESKNPAGTKEAKEKRAAWLADLPPGALVVTAEQDATAKAMTLALQAHKHAGEILRAPGLVEASGFWVDPTTRLLCRMRADKLLDGFIFDLKTIRKRATRATVQRAILEHGYDVAAAHYTAGALAITGQRHGYVWGFVEKEAPHGVRLYAASSAMLTAASAKRDRMLARLRSCILTNRWPGYADAIEELDYPTWYLNNHAAPVDDDEAEVNP